MDRIVLAYSGGLDASAAVAWLADRRGAEVVCVTLDLGQGEPLDSVRERALAAGAARAHVLDVREEFARQHLLPAFRAGASSVDGVPQISALSRPLIAKAVAEIARIEGTAFVAHGCADGGDRTRLESPLHALLPGARIAAPAAEWSTTRADRVEIVRRLGIPLPGAGADRWRVDANLWGREITSVGAAVAGLRAPVFTLTRDPVACQGGPALLDLAFEQGVPTAVNGIAMPPADAIASIGTIAGSHGVGRIDAPSSGPDGPPLRTIHEAPAAVVLIAALERLEALACPPDLLRAKRALAASYARIVRDGLWYAPDREALDALVAESLAAVTGSVRVRLHAGAAHVVDCAAARDAQPPEDRKAD